MFWTWLDYRPGMNFDSICQVMNDIGMDGIMLNAPTPDDYRAAIPVAHKHGIEVYAWLWTMNLEHDRDKILKEHPEWFSVNRNGKSLADTTAYVGYYKFLCPALPEVREFIKEKIKAYCEVEGLNGIAIDYHRFVDVVLPTTLWPHYGIVQDREYAAWDYGYHPEMLRLFKEQYGYDPASRKTLPRCEVAPVSLRPDNRSGQYDCRSGAFLRQDNGCLPRSPPRRWLHAWCVRTGANGISTSCSRWFTIPSIRVMPASFPTVRLRMYATRTI